MIVATPQTDALHSFLAAVRRRLWAAQSLDCGRSMLWQIGLLLSILAGIHHLMVPVPDSMILLGVVILVLLMLTRVLLRRPTLAASAAQADREFHGQALMTTAVEYLQQPADAGNAASNIVLQQACDAARSWRSEVSKLFRPPHAAATAVAIIPLFAAVVLLSFPGAETGGDITETIEREIPGITGREDGQSHAGTDDVATLRSVLADEDLHDERSTADEQRVDASQNLTPYRGSDANVQADQSMLPEPLDAGAGVAGTSTDDSDLPGDALASSRPPADDALTPAQIQRREIIELQRTGSIVAAGASRDATFSNTTRPISGSPVNVLPAAAPESRLYWTMLTRAQAAHARRYLAETGKTND